MSDSWDERRRAQEDGYFDKLNQAALARLGQRTKEAPRPSPITGKPMEQVTVMGVVVDRCVDSGGVWLDAGELDELMNASAPKDSPGASRLTDFVSKLMRKKG